MPAANVASGGDKFNTQGFQGVVSTPSKSNNEVARIDHDFTDKWRFMTSYRYYRYLQLTMTNQVDIGGGLRYGRHFGHRPLLRAPRPSAGSELLGGGLDDECQFDYHQRFPLQLSA